MALGLRLNVNMLIQRIFGTASGPAAGDGLLQAGTSDMFILRAGGTNGFILRAGT